MMTRLCFLICMCVFVFGKTQAQNQTVNPNSHFFNASYWNGVADKQHLSPAERKELITTQKQRFDEEQSHQHLNENELIWVTAPSQKGYNPATVNAGPCTNIDFESGTMAGWVRSTGFNPLTNAIGCCASANGDQTIMTGGTDPYGGFPCVYPLAGSFSLRLGSVATGGIADRISQTFFVTPANANFTYRYALVLNDGGHATAQQPRFTSEIIDTLGNPVNCTFYQVSAGSNSTGIVSSTLGAPGNGSPVSYKNWTDVLVDLTPNIGQNVTLRFTVYDCGPSGHFAYAYLDGLCTSFATSVADTTCPNVPITMCAPSGFSTTTWNGPGVSSNTNQCISAVLPGTYTCTTILIPGCPGPSFTHTLSMLANPALTFTPLTTGACSPQYTFNSSIGISSGSIISYLWKFGDGSTSTAPNPVHTFSGTGTYGVKLWALSNHGCMDSVTNFITIFPPPTLAFSPPSNCINTVVQFTNSSSIGVGSISGYTWTLGNGPTSNALNPTNTYSANGTYSITLNAISNQGCTASLSQTLGIFPPPIISFSANPLCDINGTSFSPATSTAIASGSLATFLWNFGDGGTSTLSNPVHIYNAPGTYTINFSAVSNHNCTASVSNTLLISPSPTVAFSTTSVNACTNNFTFTNNSAISSGPISYTWNFGGSNTSTSAAASLSYTFPTIGNYTISLVGISNMGCSDTAIQYVSIYPYPVVNFSVPASCENAIFTVSTTAVSGSVTSYAWNFGDPASGSANTSTLQNPTHFYSTTNNYTITLNILSNLNCPSSTLVPITVFPNPSAAFSFSTLNNCSLPYTYQNNSTVSAIGTSSIVSNLWNFGGAATSTLANPGTISFPGNGTYSVSLIAITNHNCSDTTSFVIPVHPKPQLNFTLTPVCQNLSATIAATSSISPLPGPGSAISSYTWDYGDNSFNGSAIPSPHTYSASGNYTVTYFATSNKGCVASLSQTQVVYAIPVINFTTTGNMCFGNTTLFTSTAAAAASTIYATNWDFGDGGTGSNPNTSHNYTTSGTYAVTFSATSNNECLSTLTKTITVHPLPVVTFTANGGCLNILSQFTPTASISSGTVATYNWDFNDGSTINGQSPSHTYTLAGNFTPSLIATSNQGCAGVATNSLVIYPLPVIQFSNPSVCAGLPMQFANTSSVSVGSITSYTWNFGDGNTTNSVQPTHSYTFAQLAPYVVSLTAISNQGCIKTGTNNAVVHPFPTINPTTINNSCINDLVSFNPNVSISGTNSVPNSTVFFGDGAFTTYTIPLQLQIAHTYTAYNTYTITIAANSNHNCLTTLATSVTIYPKPFVNFVPTAFCHKDSTLFTNVSIIPTGSISSHYWFFNDGSSSSTLQNPKHKFTAPGVYNIQLTEFSTPQPGLTCSLTTTKQLTINVLPQPNFTNNIVCHGIPTSFTNTTPQSNIVGWTWDFNNDGIPDNSQTSPAYIYPSPGNYTAALIAKNYYNCSDTVRYPIIVYANPTSTFVTSNSCLGINTSFTNQSLPGSGTSLTYSWNIGSQTLTSIQNPAFTFTLAGTYPVQLTAVSDLGCIKTCSAPVTIFELPAVNYLNSNACFSTATTFTNLSGIASGSITAWRWDFENDGIWDDSTTVNPTKNYPASGSYNCKLQAFSDKQCVATKINSVVVRGLPVAGFVNTSGLCINNPIQFTNLSTSADGAIVNNFWDFNNDGLSDRDVKSPSYTYSATGAFNVKLTVVSQFGCVSTKTGPVYINPKATPIFTSDKQDGCPDLCVTFKDASSISSGSIVSSQWDYGDGSPVDKNLKIAVHCYPTGSYNVNLQVKSDSGCISNLRIPGFINVYTNPVAAFVVEPPEIDEEEPIVEITSKATGAATTRFYISDGTNYKTTSFTHNFKKLDPKTKPMVVQIVTSQAGCIDTLYSLLNIKPAYVIYIPNVFTPNGDGLNDNFQAKGLGIIKFTMQIFDRWGKHIFTTNDITQPWDGHYKGNEEPIKEEVYVWKAEVTDVFNKTHELKGHVSVIR